MPLSSFQVMVAEPNVSDTINILRGLSERYSSFHGVRIADRYAFGSCTSGACQTSDGPQSGQSSAGTASPPRRATPQLTSHLSV